MIDNILTQEKELCKIRDPSIRQMAQICLRSRLIATYSLEDTAIKKILENPPPTIPGLLGEAFQIHLVRVLRFFLEHKEFRALCTRLNPLGQNQNSLIAFKEALLIPLRQSVGSCFATAFLIHLQRTDLFTLADDLYKTFTKKRLTRLIDDQEVKIPLCPKTGVIKALNVTIASSLMKSYEFTVASLADSRTIFSKWNFHVALGLDNEASGGLGKIIYTVIQEQMEEGVKLMEEYKGDIDQLEQSLDFDDASFKMAHTYEQMDSIKRSAKMKSYFLNVKIDEYESVGKNNSKLAALYKFFVEQYLLLFPHYFQELYDPEMFSEGDIKEDRPAGFRLVYKHGRTDSRVWTYIHTDKEYLGAIRDFLTITEPILISLKREDGLEKEIETIISEMLLFIDRKEFMEEQRIRIENMHKTHLKEEKNSSPYAYIAGGNLESLINFYLSKMQPVKKEFIKAESVMGLCHSLIEFMKDGYHADIERLLKDPFQGILISNETHAFNFLPGQAIFKRAWLDTGNTYTYIRDHLLQSNLPIIFADTNWEGKFLAFLPNSDRDDFVLVLYDGFEIFEFLNWNGEFKEGALWTLYSNK